MVLSYLPGIGCALVHRLVEAMGTPEAVFSAGSALRAIPGVGPRGYAVLNDSKLLASARRQASLQLKQVQQQQISLFSYSCKKYPAALRQIQEPPALLYCMGSMECLDNPVVAIIGSRAATEYGKRISFQLAAELAALNITVISGAALGIDAAGHRGALGQQGKTAAVLGCGVDVVYPQTHKNLYREICSNGVVISEYPLGTRPERFRFPARNRIISGLAAGVVVVEATARSGSLITARLALDQGREVFAVPGRVDSVKSAGTHRLIQQGAHLVHSSDDILEALSFSSMKPFAPQKDGGGRTDHTGDSGEEKILACLDVYPIDIDTIARVSGLEIVKLHGLLLQLELKGLIRQLPGQQYERV